MPQLLSYPSSPRRVRTPPPTVLTPAPQALSATHTTIAWHSAVASGNLAMVETLFQDGGLVDIDAHDHEGLSALHVAVTENHAEIAGFLLQNGADILDRRKKPDSGDLGHTALELAAWAGRSLSPGDRVKMVETLLNGVIAVRAGNPSTNRNEQIKKAHRMMVQIKKAHRKLITTAASAMAIRGEDEPKLLEMLMKNFG